MTDPDIANLLSQIHGNHSDRLLKLVAGDMAGEKGLLSLESLLRFFASPKFTRPILSTGSRVYGEVHDGSDWDWVVLATGTTTRDWFAKNYDYSGKALPKGDKWNYPHPDLIPSRLAGTYRFGPVNIIHVNTVQQWTIWKRGTAILLDESKVLGPRTRDRAIEVFLETMTTVYSLPVEEREALRV